ncbi:MAG TPA: pitrilysin family protein [Terriglobales bacterium]|nr:pitrilysin family protein [Terriglobales bacterium]
MTRAKGLTRNRLLSLAILAVVTLLAVPASAQTAAGSALKLPAYKKLILKNGLTILLMEQHEVPIVSFSFIVKTGAIADPEGKDGLASLTAGLLRKGTKTRTADQVAADLDFIGGQFDADASADYTSGSAEFLKKDLNRGLDLLADVLLNPTFPEAEVTKMLAQRIDGIKADKDEARGVIGSYYQSYLYGKHPYGRPTDGDESSLTRIQRADAVKFFETYYAPGNTVLSVAGDFSTPEMEKLLAQRFSEWKARPVPAASLPEPAPFHGKKLLLVDKPDSTQTFFQIGNLGITRNNPDRVQIEVVNTLFGGRFTSMLNSELRINSGLTYGARSSFDRRRVPGPFVIFSFTKNKSTEQALDMTLEVLHRLHAKGFTEEELKSAKEYIKGQFPPRIETSDQLARLMATLAFYNLDQTEIDGYYRRIDAMTLADSKRIIGQYFPEDNLVFVLIGKAGEIQAVVKKYAPKMDTKSITEPTF